MKKLLPREPTPEMVEAACKYGVAGNFGMMASDAESAFKAMWDAAPALPDPGEVERRLRDFHIEHSHNLRIEAADLIAALRAEIKTAQNWCAIHKANAEKAEAELKNHLHLDNHNSIVRNLQEQIKNVEAECERLREALPDPNKLRILADWVDFKFPNDPSPEIQTDLRKWAAAIDAARKPLT